ncbi:carbon-nitrogen hydrolase family protein [Sulfitobacter sp. F26204]|uniref:carbon-nitrogen hydrolase family protein n=1 Tax=Sulfitobacter sp. F26204 TaxID=2996014 RepID=UPI00225DDAED|nr:carbon-nitrogen hydrolase family protein [Sulfitobacter sp. F26204]MCX7558283.1 carbon-nitrogen hydrolase family protein [Sulfitobacter sp. F26204]
MQGAILQLNVSDDPVANLDQTLGMLRKAIVDGAQFVLTPEVTNCISTSRKHQQQVLQFEDEDITLTALRTEARAAGIWLLIGSLGLKTTDADQRFANRSFMIAPDGEIVAKYDKIHMFDVQISETETWRESEGYRPGTQAVLVDTEFAKVGLSICYDVRFSHLYRALANAGAQILTVPAAFSPVTGAAHWHALLRARAIESGCFVIAPAQTGTHASASNKTRDTYGHSLVIDPWGEVLLDAGTASGVYKFNLDMEKGMAARQRVPSLVNARDFSGP